jgi:hypothetical protein
MNTKMLKHVRELFNVPYVARELNRANQLKWIKSVRLLGDNWLLAKQIGRLSESRT